MTSRAVTWKVTASRGFETAWVELGEDRLSARGRAFGRTDEKDSVPYWVSYELRTGAGWVTQRLSVTVELEEETRTLDLRRGDGGWTVDGSPRPELAEALDCDLGFCPLTNTMPILRHDLHRTAGEHDFLMAWVAVPELTVVPSRQRCVTVSAGIADSWAVVGYRSGSFKSDLVIDDDGLVVDYPQLARRLDRR